ncbi:hypothetical protein [Rufibacter latericius]|uniref:Uncharacterized protein n=1 Tax=Rufibacter latericius TaxID=2487040 RepID=A0A3M9N0K6_9BACT|nr:hypothetical protein [Rufibacter latericius]RNI30538.1 hypothetical protein EFB08_04605 [Rufibacter latericius]
MNKRYDLLLGFALLLAVTTGYFFNKNQYFHATTGEEISRTVYKGLENKTKWREEWHFNYEAGFTAGLATLGLGLVFFGLVGRSRKKKLPVKLVD